MTKDEILQAAAQIFRLKGFHAASMQDIADAVQLRKASLYHHVTSKQEILVDLLDHAMDLLIARAEEIHAQPAGPAERLRMAVHSYLGTLIENRDLAAVLLLEYRSLEPEFRARHQPRRDEYEYLWREIVAALVKENGNQDVDVPLIVRTILGGINWSITWYQPGGQYTGAEIADRMADFFIAGLMRPGGEHE